MSSYDADARSWTSVLRRRKGVIAVAAVLAAAGAVAFVLFVPPKLTSTALVLLPAPAVAVTSSSDVSTQMRIATSATVLDRAGEAMMPPLSARQVEKMIDVTAPTDQIIQIDVSSRNGSEAQALSQAVSAAYVEYVSDTAREVSAAALADLNVRRDRLRAQITQLQQEIKASNQRQNQAAANSPDARKEAQLLAGLRTQQANLSLQLDKVEDKIATGSGASAGTATSVIQPATAALGPALATRLLFLIPIVALAGALLTAVVMIVLAKRDPHVRLRDEIADAVGSPVLAAVRSRPQRTAAAWLTLLQNYEASPVESWAFRQLLRSLAQPETKRNPSSGGRLEYPSTIAVASLSGDLCGLAIGPQLAAFASSLGLRTRLITAQDDAGAAAPLWVACGSDRSETLNDGLLIGRVADGIPVDLTVTLFVLNKINPTLTEAANSTSLVLSVAPGAATEQELASVAVAADDAGHRLDGVVVASPDSTDQTSGRHTMIERTRHPAVPVRLTGVAPLTPRSPVSRKRSRP
jgi:hypothetical protein